MYRRTLITTILLCGLASVDPGTFSGQAQHFQGHKHQSLKYPIRVVEAEPYWQPAGKWALESPLTTLGAMRALHRELGTLPAERLRLPVPNSTWKLTGRVTQTNDGTIYAAFGHYLYWSRDEGRSWEGMAMTSLPGAHGQPLGGAAFGGDGHSIFLAHPHRGLPPVDSEGSKPSYPIVISRSRDGGKTWQTSPPLKYPFRYAGGDGDHIISLGGGQLLANLDGYGGSSDPTIKEKSALLLFRSTDGGKDWSLDSYLPGVAETGFAYLGVRRLLAALRWEGDELDQKTVRLVNSEDAGRTWHSHRPLTRIYGQAHADLTVLPGGGLVATYENRYPYAEGGATYARLSWNEGKTWEPRLYQLTRGHGYSGSVVMKDGTIVTVAGDGQLSRVGQPTGRGYTLQALRWKPLPKPSAGRAAPKPSD